MHVRGVGHQREAVCRDALPNTRHARPMVNASAQRSGVLREPELVSLRVILAVGLPLRRERPREARN